MKTYTTTHNNGRVKTFSYRKRSTWNSPRWVIDHLKNHVRRSDINDLYVIELDLKTLNVKKYTALEFLTIHGKNEAYNSACLEIFGFYIEPINLKNLYLKRLISQNPVILAKIENLLEGYAGYRLQIG